MLKITVRSAVFTTLNVALFLGCSGSEFASERGSKDSADAKKAPRAPQESAPPPPAETLAPTAPREVLLLQNVLVDIGAGSPTVSQEYPKFFAEKFKGQSYRDTKVAIPLPAVEDKSLKVTSVAFSGRDGLLFPLAKLCPASESRFIAESIKTEQGPTHPGLGWVSVGIGLNKLSICGHEFEAPEHKSWIFGADRPFESFAQKAKEPLDLVMVTPWATRVNKSQFDQALAKLSRSTRVHFVYPKTDACSQLMKYPVGDDINSLPYIKFFGRGDKIYEDIAAGTKGSTADFCSVNWPDFWKTLSKY